MNALLSFGYTLLAEDMVAACEVVGLDPYDGFLHADRYGRVGLALDLMEEFRGVVVDSVVLRLVNRRMLDHADFALMDRGAYLRRRELGVFLRQYTARLNARVLHPELGRRLTYQQWLEVQARRLRACLETPGREYCAFSTR